MNPDLADMSQFGRILRMPTQRKEKSSSIETTSSNLQRVTLMSSVDQFRTTPVRRRLSTVVRSVLAVAALTLAGCGGGDGSGSPTAAAGSPVETPSGGSGGGGSGSGTTNAPLPVVYFADQDTFDITELHLVDPTTTGG